MPRYSKIAVCAYGREQRAVLTAKDTRKYLLDTLDADVFMSVSAEADFKQGLHGKYLHLWNVSKTAAKGEVRVFSKNLSDLECPLFVLFATSIGYLSFPHVLPKLELTTTLFFWSPHVSLCSLGSSSRCTGSTEM
mmetsp:Transcript_29523/g.47328  ORF Transcript_29523/g.47328 Transcript_29523/m.47328 type:complete len:135 (-) Transcript_29523:1069-1473(-)